MSEVLILAAIVAPLVLVPAIILSFMSEVDGLWWPHTEIVIDFGIDFEPSPFLEFQRAMHAEICRYWSVPAPAPGPSPAEAVIRRFEVMAAVTVFASPKVDQA